MKSWVSSLLVMSLLSTNPQRSLAASGFSSKFSREERISTSNKGSKTYGRFLLNGPVVLFWEAFGGWSDDEYLVQIQDDKSKDFLYQTPQFSSDRSDISPEVTGIETPGNYNVRLACNLEGPLKNCDGDFGWVLVDCGCPADKPIKVQDCNLASMDTVEAAFCRDSETSEADITGEWITEVSGPEISFAVTHGTTTTESTSVTNSQASSFTASISAGFEFKAVSASVTLSSTQSSAVAKQVSTSISTKVETKITASCPDLSLSSNGQWFLWQWKMGQEQDQNGPGFDSKTSNFVCTESNQMEPRCPLGFCADLKCQTCDPPFEDIGDVQASCTCFSGINTVEVKGKGFVTMASLQIGDFVRASRGAFSQVYSFGHMDQNVEGDYLQIYSTGHERTPLEISPKHMVYVEGKYVRASQVKVGDKFGMENHFVTQILPIKRRGVYAPITKSGDIVVSGVLASSYVAFLDYSPIMQHAAAHAIFAPHRWVCSFNFEVCENETYTDGISDLTTKPLLKVVLNLSKQSIFVQTAATILAAPVMVAAYALEQIATPRLIGILLLSFLFYKKAKESRMKAQT